MTTTTFEYTPRRTMDYCNAPHVREDGATRVTDGTRYSTWGFAVECEACGERDECPGASSVTAEDHPARFAAAHRECLPAWKRDKLETEHLIAEAQGIAARMADGRIPHFYGERLERIGKRLQELHRR